MAKCHGKTCSSLLVATLAFVAAVAGALDVEVDLAQSCIHVLDAIDVGAHFPGEILEEASECSPGIGCFVVSPPLDANLQLVLVVKLPSHKLFREVAVGILVGAFH